MQSQLLDQLLTRLRQPNETEAAVLARLRLADSRLTELYRRSDVEASAGYADPMVRAAYLLRYLPHYTLQLGDMLHHLEGSPDVARLFCMPRLRHASLCGGPAPEPIALAVLHAQGGGSELRSTVLDRQAEHWGDCWPVSCSLARQHSEHANVQIDGQTTNLAQVCTLQERQLLAGCHLFTLMNALNELMLIGSDQLRRQLEMRMACLPQGALVLISDQANYKRCQQGMELLTGVLADMGARILISRTTAEDAHAVANRFQLDARLATIYNQSGGDGGPRTNAYRIHNHGLQLAAVMPGH